MRKFKSKTLLIALFTTTFLLGCGAKDLKDYNKLEGMRVIAIHSTTPEVNPGATVTFTPVIADVDGSGTPSETVAACEDPGVGIGAEPTCTGATAITVTAGAALSLDTSIRIGTGTAYSLTVPTTYLSSSNALTQWNGRVLLFTYSVTNSSGSTTKSFARVTVSTSTKTAKNQNPGLTSILYDGSALSSIPTSTGSLSVQLPSGAAESYTQISLTGDSQTLTETIQTTWFLARGSVKYFRSLSNETNPYTPPSDTSQANAFVVVTRDGRGGESIRTIGLTANLSLQ